MNQIEFPHITIWYEEPVVHFKFKEGAHLDTKEIKEMFSAAEKICDNKPHIIMVDARVYFTATSQARKTGADKNETPLVLAAAVLVNNLASELIANFFASFNKPHFNFRVFHDEKKAMKWLLQHQEVKS